jgi:hypothetical protein
MKRIRHTMVLTIERIERNRAIRNETLDNILIASFEGFRPLSGPKNDSASRPTNRTLQPATWKECSDYIVHLLRSGISLQGVRYNFYGHSNSQLKSKTCFLFAASKQEISRKVEALGDFSKMKTVAKKAKRIGLLFSTAQIATHVPSERCEDIADIETDDYIFTDGCGLISPILAKELARKVRIVFRDKRYTPSVFQLRYKGYKGVVTVDPRMSKSRYLLRMRKSMKKFSGSDDESFAVVEYSKVSSEGVVSTLLPLTELLTISRSSRTLMAF